MADWFPEFEQDVTEERETNSLDGVVPAAWERWRLAGALREARNWPARSPASRTDGVISDRKSLLCNESACKRCKNRCRNGAEMVPDR